MLLLLLASGPAAPARAQTRDVHLAPATPGAVRFTLSVPEPTFVATGDPSGDQILSMDGFDRFGDVGTPGLPRRILTVAVPPLGPVRVSSAVSEVAVLEGLTLAPQPPPDSAAALRGFRSLAAYGAAGSTAPAGARLIDVTWLRNQRVARIAIEPAAYQPSQRRLSVARRIDIDVQVQPLGAIGMPAEPVDPFEHVYAHSLVNYEQGRTWRRPETRTLLATARRLGVRLDAALATTPPEANVFHGHAWVKIAVRKPGFYAVDFNSLRTTKLFAPYNPPTNPAAPYSALRLFTLPGYPLLPEQTYCDTCTMHEVAIGISDVDDLGASSTDGLFGSNKDMIYFYAQGPNGWATDFDSSYPDTVYLDHPYDIANDYYLTISTPTDSVPLPGTPARIVSRTDAQPTGAGTPVTTIPARRHFEQDYEYWPNATSLGSTLFWEKWFWQSMPESSAVDVAFDLPGADPTQPARFRLRQWGLTDNTTSFYNHIPCVHSVGTTWHDHYIDVTMNGMTFHPAWDAYTAERGGALTIDTTAAFVRPTANHFNVFTPKVPRSSECPDRVDVSGLAWFEVYYQRDLVPDGDSLDIRPPSPSGLYRYDIGPFSSASPPRVFDVTDPVTPVELHLGTGMWDDVARRVSFEDAASANRHYVVVPDSVIKLARVLSTDIADASPALTSDNLRSSGNQADYLVIYYDGFAAAAAALVAERSQHLPLAGRTPPFVAKAVPVSEVYDQFSGGRTDPAAIRNFLRTVYLNWRAPKPGFVLLLGDASYDYKNILGYAPSGQPGCLLPTYENCFDNYFAILRQFVTDDWMFNVTDPNSFLPDFFGGRLPADDPSTALAVVRNKLAAYENAAPLGEYRNSVVLLADDDVQGTSCDGIAWGHLQQTDQLNRYDVPLHADREYVYLHTYPTGAGGTKPAARAELKSYLDAGTTLFNFVGHGSPFKLTDESVFIDTDAGSLQNGSKLFVFVGASCDVGRFSDPTLQSLGEQLVVTTGGGAIAVVSATEEALSGENSNLNRYLYDQLFRRDSLQFGIDTLLSTGQYHVPLSAALLVAKIRAPGTEVTNNVKYQLMGDPATVLNEPHLWADLALTDASGNALNPATLQRGSTVTVHGRVLDQPGGTAQPFTGVVQLLVEDSAPTNSTAGNGNPYEGETDEHSACSGSTYQALYLYRAGTIFHGALSAANGTFTGRFVVPMDATLGSLARVRAYVENDAAPSRDVADGVGAIPCTVTPGTASTTDTEGPRILLSFVGGSLEVRPDATLRIDISDESGIMTTGHLLQNSIVVTVDDQTTSRVDVTSSFRYAADSYQTGRATFSLPGLSPGHHKISVSAADNLASGINAAAHRSAATLEFDVVARPTLSITRAYLFPNPTRSTGPGAGGTFVVDAPGDSLNSMLRIFTISGRVVRTLKQFGALGQVQFQWDGRDAEGAPLANGTYLFKVYGNARQADGMSSPSEKATATGKIVIVNRPSGK